MLVTAVLYATTWTMPQSIVPVPSLHRALRIVTSMWASSIGPSGISHTCTSRLPQSSHQALKKCAVISIRGTCPNATSSCPYTYTCSSCSSPSHRYSRCPDRKDEGKNKGRLPLCTPSSSKFSQPPRHQSSQLHAQR